jgi:hypothetical protein
MMIWKLEPIDSIRCEYHAVEEKKKKKKRRRRRKKKMGR